MLCCFYPVRYALQLPLPLQCTQYLLNVFLRVERRASKSFMLDDFPSFTVAADRMCKKLFINILKNEDHPLRCMFDARTPTYRNPLSVRPPFAKTARLGNSFIKYAKA